MITTMPFIENALIFAASNPVTEIAETFHVEWPKVIAQMVNFIIVAYVLYRFAFKPINDVIDQRRKQINDGLQYAEEMKKKLAETEKKYQETLKQGTLEAQRTIDEARRVAQELMEKQTQDAVNRAEDIITNARNAAALERDKVMEEARREIKNMVVDTTEKVLNKELDDAERKRYSDTAAKELAASN